MIFYQELGDVNINDVSQVLGLQNGWFVAVILLIFVAYLLLRGHIVSRRTMETQIKVLEQSLDDERESRQLWQASTVELLKTSDVERDNSRHMLTVVETTLKIVTDLQNARQTIQVEKAGE